METLLEHYIKDHSQTVETVYIDDCCKLIMRQKICSVLGKDVSVKLDSFHTVQRITKTLRKSSMLFNHYGKDLSLVIRQDGDSGNKRKSDTPESNTMLKNMEIFVEKWKESVTTKGPLCLLVTHFQRLTT